MLDDLKSLSVRHFGLGSLELRAVMAWGGQCLSVRRINC